MLKIYINGSSGKMGQSLTNLINQSQELNLVTKDISLSDVVIDFSHPDSTIEIIKDCSRNKIPLIVGTTNLNEETLIEIKMASKYIPILLAANMSIGILQLKESLVAFIKSNKQKIECSIEEIHHSNKLDAPSGTAIEIKDLIKNTDNKSNINQIKINSKRIDNVFGIHKITFINEESSIDFKHEALSRDIYANGAIKCAMKIHNLEPNIYKFEDIIN
jgi:4-hydroxy-tetrahydrodipicolinate reductase|tara:strand:- start:7 stop:660 length:654 start_codon:yes stop_codon:yes gene_type:complete